MTGLNGHRVYLDWNATAPLRPEARAAMLEAMDLVGNPSSVHAEGRAAKAVIEKARGQVAELIGGQTNEIVFTSGATEAVGLVASQRHIRHGLAVEHDCTARYMENILPVDASGLFAYGQKIQVLAPDSDLIAFQVANSETGVIQDPEVLEFDGPHIVDAVQAVGKIDFDFIEWPARFAFLSAHKFGGPKGVGALVCYDELREPALFEGGGQEQGRRSGTENVIGIAGFGAAAEAAQRDLEAGVWDHVEKLRDALEDKLAAAAPDLIIFGKDAPRLPNTSCFAIRGWRGETQVMQMDLAGFAVSAGSACSSGKVGPSRVILAMTGDEELARSSIRVSMGPTTTEAEVMAFADAWIEHHARRAKNAA